MLAPLVVPLLVALVLALGSGGSAWFSFLLFFGIGCVFSFGGTIGLLWPTGVALTALDSLGGCHLGLRSRCSLHPRLV